MIQLCTQSIYSRSLQKWSRPSGSRPHVENHWSRANTVV